MKLIDAAIFHRGEPPKKHQARPQVELACRYRPVTLHTQGKRTIVTGQSPQIAGNRGLKNVELVCRLCSSRKLWVFTLVTRVKKLTPASKMCDRSGPII